MDDASTLEILRENLRLQQIYNVFMRYGLDVGFDRFPTVAALRHRMQRWLWNLPDDLETPPLPVKVRLMIEELGPTFVKVGQIVSSQASVIPPDWEAELAKLQSNVPPFPSDQVGAIVQEQLGGSPDELYASFDPEPFAAASTAQVHRATLLDGTAVVVKVQRPHIARQMKADVGIMRNAARVLSRRSRFLRAIDLEGMVTEFGSNAILELNYGGEAYNAYRLARSMEAVPGVSIPTVYPELSAERVLTMDFVRGVKISDLARIDAAGLDRERLAYSALHAIVKQLLIDGFFHADPHPGNILVDLDTGDITFIDTGMVGELDLGQRLNIIQLLIAVQQSDVRGMATVMKNLSSPFVARVDHKAYMKDFERTIGRVMYMGAATDFGQAVNLALDLLRKHGLRLDANLTLAVKALLQAQEISGLLYPSGGIVAHGVQIVQEEAAKAVTADRVIDEAKKQAVDLARELGGSIPSLSEATLKWLRQYQKGRFEVYVDTSALAKEVDKAGEIAQRMTVVIMLVGVLIGSAIATTGIGLGGFQGEFWRIITQVAVVSYVVSTVAALLIVTRLLWRWARGDSGGG